MGTKGRTTIPTATASHAAFVACRAAKEARQEFGADESRAANVYAATYAAVMRGER